MKISPAGLAALAAREGVRLHAYLDTRGIPTIGVGHTSAAGPPEVHMGDTISADECNAILARDIAPLETKITAAVRVPITQDQFDALVSFAFNIGIGGFLKSTALRRLNTGDRHGAALAMGMWNKPPEIIGRRQSEIAQFLGS